MRVENEICAKVMSDILAEGMSLSDFNLGESVRTEAAAALEEIRQVMYNRNTDEHNKLRTIKGIMDRYNIKRTGV